MKMSNVRIGIVGCGHWGKNYVRLFSTLERTELVAVADPRAAARDQARKLAPQAQLFEDHTALLKSVSCDCLVVATVASTHYGIIKEALEAGLDILAEKPFTLNVAEAEELCELADAKNRMLMVAHTFLFNPSVIQLKKYINDGVLGDVYYMRARRTHLGLIRQDVNAVWDLAPHDVSMFLHFLGELPDEMQAMGRKVLKSDQEDVAFVNMAFPSGVIAQIDVSWADSNKQRNLDIIGSKSRVVFDDLNIQEPIRIFEKGISVERGAESTFGEFKYLQRDGDIISPKIAVQEPLRVLCNAFLEAVANRKVTISDGRFGRDVVDVLCRIQDALKRNAAATGVS